MAFEGPCDGEGKLLEGTKGAAEARYTCREGVPFCDDKEFELDEAGKRDVIAAEDVAGGGVLGGGGEDMGEDPVGDDDGYLGGFEGV